MSGTQPIATLELDESLEWVDPPPPRIFPLIAELPLPEGKGWAMPPCQLRQPYPDSNVTPTRWYIEWSTPVRAVIPKDAIIEVRYSDGTSERVRVVDVLGVEQQWRTTVEGPTECKGRLMPHLRCVVVPA